MWNYKPTSLTKIQIYAEVGYAKSSLCQRTALDLQTFFCDLNLRPLLFGKWFFHKWTMLIDRRGNSVSNLRVDYICLIKMHDIVWGFQVAFNIFN